MSFRLRKNKPLQREVLRVARNELEDALKEVLTAGEQSRNTAVHEARKHLKKLRALIRLLRPVTGRAFSKRENAVLRKAAQRMSSIRDAHVCVQTIDKIIARSRTKRPSAALTRVRDAMVARLGQALDQAEKDDWEKKAAADLEKALCRLSDWPLKRLTPNSLRGGLKTACKKARRALAAARRERTDQNLHDLRKAAKNLWYDLCLLAGDRPPAIKALTKRMDELGEKLGDDHDLAMLIAARADNPLPDPTDWEALAAAIAPRRQRLKRAALRCAAKALVRKPGGFADFVIDYWRKA